MSNNVEIINSAESLKIFIKNWISAYDNNVIRTWLVSSAAIETAMLFPAAAIQLDGHRPSGNGRVFNGKIRIYVYGDINSAGAKCEAAADLVYAILKRQSPIGQYPLGWGGIRDITITNYDGFPDGGYVYVSDINFNLTIA